MPADRAQKRQSSDHWELPRRRETVKNTQWTIRMRGIVEFTKRNMAAVNVMRWCANTETDRRHHAFFVRKFGTVTLLNGTHTYQIRLGPIKTLRCTVSTLQTKRRK